MSTAWIMFAIIVAAIGIALLLTRAEDRRRSQREHERLLELAEDHAKKSGL